MDPSSSERISEERARAIWRRAAELQAEAERRMEENVRRLGAGEGEGGALDGDPGEGLATGDVVAAAEEAGISPEFVRIAMAEIATGGAPTGAMRPWEERAATRLLGMAERSLTLTRTVAAPLERTLEAALRVLPAHPSLLLVRDVLELAPEGRVVLFDVPKFDWSATSNPTFVEHAGMVGLRRVHLTVRPLPGTPVRCEVILGADLREGIRKSWRTGSLLSLGTGVAGGAGATLLGVSALGGALAFLPAVAGAAVFGGVLAGIWGPTYRWYLRRVRDTLEESLRTLDASARVSGTGDPVRGLPRG